MRRSFLVIVLVVGIVGLFYAFGLGVYVVSSTRPEVPTQPESAEAARVSLESIGLGAEYPFESRFVETPGGRMHYVDEGRGAPVLCLHGQPTWSFLYRDFVKGLSGSMRVIAPDLVGFGLSEKPARPEDYSIEGHVRDVIALVEALDLRNLTLVLHDWGGPIGLGVALRHPERVSRLVVLNTFVPYRPPANGRLPMPIRVVRAPVVGELLVQGLALFNRVFVPRAIRNPAHRTEVVLAAYGRVQGNWQERAGTMAFPRLIPVRPGDPGVELFEREDRWLRTFRGPALIVWGMADPFFDRRTLDAWRERLPEAAVLEIPEAGHFLQEDAPERVVGRIREFLTRGSS
jgi:haloalkane dehalogenase